MRLGDDGPADAASPVGGVDSVSALYARPADAWATLVVAHGAGTGMEHPFLAGFASAVRALGVATLRFDFPYREAGRKFPDRPPVAIATWRAAAAYARERAIDASADAGEPIWVSGKSFGGRMASMAVADGMPASGLAFLGYPLHPPGRPEKARDEHLPDLAAPILFLQGRNDPFAAPNEQLDDLVARLRSERGTTGCAVDLEWIADANHSFEIKGRKRPAHEIGASLAASVVDFMRANPA
ncbi:alpha/beta family hydrolase [Agromyces sp. Leaf222]|uniref:alpha/beta hydrolase family protein n=1 Tax=Agromyces sp. Leaf222 TaxID=1735688 RepID=UPI0006F47447|nr:alpha/beta family hydrolase [Agromyces sp. Leaf222]KQM81547.1 dienelactone hydrolase [Agromyces sp. Leaf222]